MSVSHRVVPKQDIQPQKLEALLGTMINELGAAANAALVILGDKLGLYGALAQGAATPGELARRTGTNERYVREWLSAQAASGFVTFEPSTGLFSLSPEQAAILANEQSPVFMMGGFQSLAAVYHSEPKLTEAFRSGAGIPWGAHCSCLFCGTERFFRTGYRAHLLGEWLPALDGVVDRLKVGGARVADVGCGHGASTILMAEAYPRAQFVGFDVHEPSIRTAREQAGSIGNLRFEVATAHDFAGEYDLVTMFDALHDMGDPVGAARRAREVLKPGGVLMLVEPMAADRLQDNFNPVGRSFYAFSTSFCVPGSMSQPVAAALGAQAGEAKLRDVAREAGFTRFRRAAQTPFNMVLEARV
jgi:2-polyprenyl-3-methyl-5-hydroxy-6-metoxy-1,4-benzoquinol methylase